MTDVGFWGMATLLVLYTFITNYLLAIIRRGPKRKFRRSIIDGSPITPRHESPSLPLKEGWGVGDDDNRFLADFDIFATILNRWLDDTPWRIQELDDPELGGVMALPDSPSYGRRYDIFFNQIRLGTLEITAVHGYGSDHQNISAAIELTYARLLTFNSIKSFISFLSSLATSNVEEQQRVLFLMHDSMLQRLWQIEYDYQLDDRSLGGDFELQFEGSAARYLKIRARSRGAWLHRRR